MAKLNPQRISLDRTLLDRLDQLNDSATLPKPISSFRLENSTGEINEPIQRIPSICLDGSSQVESAVSPSPDFLESGVADISQTSIHRVKCDDGDIWLSGTSLLCSCPDCTAPMTVRIWLRLADCWRCHTSISLSEEQYQAALELEQQLKPREKPTPQRRSHALPAPPPAPINERPRFEPPTEPDSFDPREREFEELSQGSWVANLVRNGFRLTPAWMVSFLIHLIVILILALIFIGDKSFLPSTITLSTFLSAEDQAGGEVRFDNPLDALQDDLMTAGDMEKGDRELREVLRKAEQDARKLQVDPNPKAPLRELSQIKKNITTRPDNLMSFAARDPRVRSEMVRKEGGTTVTEAAVARGLRWLASVQNKDGGWSLKNYDRHNNPRNKSDIMATSLALLPMLGAGQTHEFGAYKENVAAGLAWIIKNQKKNGDLRAGFDGNAGMYAHGQGAIVLCEALALTGDQTFQEPAQLAIRFIEFAQHSQGGWRYKPGQAGDTSVFGWQMMALQSAQAPDINLEVDDSTLKLADYFLDRVIANASYKSRPDRNLPDGSAYCYQKGKKATAAMTAEAILCRMYLGWKKDDPRLSTSVKWLIKDHLPSSRDRNLYYWYYGTQVMHHYGGKPWETWNNRMRPLLISTQKTRGSNAGSWEPRQFEWGGQGGRIYTTSLAVCTLEVYYRHLPLFKQIELD
jgi:hypothetical protein